MSLTTESVIFEQARQLMARCSQYLPVQALHHGLLRKEEIVLREGSLVGMGPDERQSLS
jgi:hypothetical protein